MKNLKYLLDRFSGKEVSHARIRIKSVYSGVVTTLDFDQIIEGVYLTKILSVDLTIFNRLVDDQKNDSEFDYFFNKPAFKENFLEDFYDHFNLKVLGVGEEEVYFNFKFK